MVGKFFLKYFDLSDCEKNSEKWNNFTYFHFEPDYFYDLEKINQNSIRLYFDYYGRKGVWQTVDGSKTHYLLSVRYTGSILITGVINFMQKPFDGKIECEIKKNIFAKYPTLVINNKVLGNIEIKFNKFKLEKMDCYHDRVDNEKKLADRDLENEIKNNPINSIEDQAIMEVTQDGVYRYKNENKIFGKSIMVFVKNFNYFLSELKIYEDGLIDCCELMDFDGFKKQVKLGIICSKIPNGSVLDIFSLGSYVISEAEHDVEEEDLIIEVADIIKELKGEKTLTQICCEFYNLCLLNPNIENKLNLKKAYESVPKHLRQYLLGDMDNRDDAIKDIIY